MDDIQLLSGREKMQEELFHLFNILYEKGKQIIFSSDKHPNSIPGLEDRLRSRFSAGMIIDIVKPEYESRMAILKTKIRESGREVPFEVLDFIASHVEGNIRELEGILNSIIVHIDTKGKAPEVQDIKSLIKNNIKPKKHVSLEEIIKTIARFYDTEESLIYEKTRRQEIVHCRQVVMFLLREDFGISFPLIGKKLGGRDHTTVMHSYKKIKTDIETNSDLVREIEQIRSMLSM
jgi:chromosomal replication initiator protein